MKCTTGDEFTIKFHLSMLVLEIMEEINEKSNQLDQLCCVPWFLFTLHILVEPFVKLLIVFLCGLSLTRILVAPDWNFELRIYFYSDWYLFFLSEDSIKTWTALYLTVWSDIDDLIRLRLQLVVLFFGWNDTFRHLSNFIVHY